MGAQNGDGLGDARAGDIDRLDVHAKGEDLVELLLEVGSRAQDEAFVEVRARIIEGPLEPRHMSYPRGVLGVVDENDVAPSFRQKEPTDFVGRTSPIHVDGKDARHVLIHRNHRKEALSKQSDRRTAQGVQRVDQSRPSTQASFISRIHLLRKSPRTGSREFHATLLTFPRTRSRTATDPRRNCDQSQKKGVRREGSFFSL
jgi:hypothetical protein